MADNYGVTFAQKLIQQGNYEEAILAANKHLVQDPASPEPYHDRARALAGLGRADSGQISVLGYHGTLRPATAKRTASCRRSRLDLAL